MHTRSKFIPTIGADPEMFVTDENGNIRSAVGMLGGSKDNPRPLGGGYFVQEDNVMAEFNIPPAETVDEFVHYIQKGIEATQSVLKPGYGLVPQCAHVFDPKELNNAQAMTSGCDPDFNAWTREMRAGFNFEKLPEPCTRFCGGHIHLAYDMEKFGKPGTNETLVKGLDWTIGLAMALIERDKRRANIFGTFGMFRPKKYGVEYRSPSNFWLSDEAYIRFVAECSLKAAARPTFIGNSGDIEYLENAASKPTKRSLDHLQCNLYALRVDLDNHTKIFKDINARILEK